jgi:hypothetical protein
MSLLQPYRFRDKRKSDFRCSQAVETDLAVFTGRKKPEAVGLGLMRNRKATKP